MSQIIEHPHSTALTSLIQQDDITRVMGKYCPIRLDNGAESFWHNGHYVCEANGAYGETGVSDIARLTARAGGHSLRCIELPVPDGEWCWGDIAETLARSALSETVRASCIVTGCVTAQGRGALLQSSAAERRQLESVVSNWQQRRLVCGCGTDSDHERFSRKSHQSFTAS
ncbi:hypothetical protein [Pantoea vagans]|uniref:hypothetical protein n=1 Tax=Pantoea vagans TaxID=470934 RepID=UPI0023B1AF4C|nr:hypothetical protein [Pantoea vagans]MDE8559229.1 hypothetical protein [Pantoea vagans]MDE8579229.1 hypothetical protein [Pantoea vagans]